MQTQQLLFHTPHTGLLGCVSTQGATQQSPTLQHGNFILVNNTAASIISGYDYSS